MKHKFSRRKANIICYMLIITIIIGLFSNYSTTTYGYTEKDGIVIGISDGSTLNVRLGAGTGYDIVVGIPNSTIVKIVGEKKANDGSLWYNIKFTYNNKEYSGYCYGTYIKIVEKSDNKFEAYLTEQKFPESYKPYLRTLHEKYPNWVFKADVLTCTWDEALKAESVVGNNLVENTSISSWKSTASGAYDWTTGTWTVFDGKNTSWQWVAASKEMIAYCMDPRNFLDETYIFQFESLEYQPEIHNETGLQTIIGGSFMSKNNLEDDRTYSEVLMEAAEISGVSPYYLGASIIQEIGYTTPSKIVSGTVTGYKGIYNYYNWGAYDSKDGTDAITNGLIFASGTNEEEMRPWNTRYKAIVGGAIKFYNEYVKRGQYTNYYKKFNVLKGAFNHQYMTNVRGAKLEAAKTANGYSLEDKKSREFIFSIPVYKDMPEGVNACPTKTGSPNNALKSLSISSGTFTPTFDKKKPIDTLKFSTTVPNSVNQITISAAAYDTKANVSGTGQKELKVGSNKFSIKVTAENGNVRTYTVTIVRAEGTKKEPTYSTKYTVDDSKKYISGLAIESSVSTVLKKITVSDGTTVILDKSGKKKTEGLVGTGDILEILDGDGKVFAKYTFILYGDVNGDGKINLLDALKVRKHNLELSKLKTVYLYAGNVNRSEDGVVNLLDALIIRKYNLGLRTINQN